MNRIEHQRSRGILPAALCLWATIAFVPGCSSSPGTASPTGISESTAPVTSPDPSSTPSSTPTQTPTPTPTPTYKPASAEGPAENVPLPVMPEAAKVESKEGLEAFALYWYELLNYGYKTGNSEPIRSVTSPNCAAANNFHEEVTDGYENGAWMAGSEIDVRVITSNYVLTIESRYQLELEIFQEPLEYYEVDGTSRIMHPRVNPGRQLFEALYSPNGWRVENVVSLQASSS